MNILIGTSLVASFIAGIAALFAPCCITVLLPSYLGSVFRERKKVFIMTFIFFLGILLVFLPLGLGFAAFGQALSKYHNTIFIVGGGFLLVLGLSLVLGRHFSLPFHVNPTLKNHSPFSVFTLGIFSGVATTCCAPVLAGVLALSALPGSVAWGALYTFVYVLGIVSPLFVIASFLDRNALTQKMMRAQTPLSYSLGSLRITVTIGELISGALFIIMAVFTLWLSFTNSLTVHSSYQVSINIFLTKVFNAVAGVVKAVPEFLWAVLFIFVIFAIIIKTVQLFKKETYEQKQAALLREEDTQ